MGAVVYDEELFATEIVLCVGAVIGVVIAESHEQAVAAASKVLVAYEELPSIISIEDAITANAFYPDTHAIVSGDLDEASEGAEVVVRGEVRLGGQDHFYLETNCALVVPSENGQLDVLSSTQNPTKTQNFCASVCGIPAHKVVSKCKRMGGGFGGKETRSVFIACAAALAAYKLQKPVRINIERDVDMSITGHRHPFLCRYTAGCSTDGTLRFLQAELFSNAGCSMDLSLPVMDRALFHSDACYHWPALSVVGKLCRTNLPSNTAFRGFGAPQGMMMAETALEHLAQAAGLDPQFVRHRNLYREGQATHFKMPLVDFHIPRLWDKVEAVADVAGRRDAVVRFNKEHRWKKRGLATVPVKFGISFTAKFMNQGGALVHIYTDGSVLVSHGGTEMGQGLHTKVIQIAAQAFGIPDSQVYISETSTNTVPNSSPTAASMSTDLYGMAVLDACTQILDRLRPLRQHDEDWHSLIKKAYFERINLSAQGFFVVPGDRCGYNWSLTVDDNASRGQPFNYFTQGVACSEVEVDVLTGDARVLRVDVCMDLGNSINPALDIGQIEGALMQGIGWCTTEEVIWGDSQHPWARRGQLVTRGPGSYKVPAFNDVPVNFNIHLMRTDNRFAIHSSKAVGEPPFFLGCSAFFAIKQAVAAARTDNGLQEYYPLQHPATSERIRMAAGDSLSQSCTRLNSSFQPKYSC